MHLSRAELVRLEAMFASGQVRSDPLALSETDQMMDAMHRAARTKADVRMLSSQASQSSPGAPASMSCARETEAKALVSDSNGSGEPQSSWTIPHKLEDLIRIRKALLRGEGRDA